MDDTNPPVSKNRSIGIKRRAALTARQNSFEREAL